MRWGSARCKHWWLVGPQYTFILSGIIFILDLTTWILIHLYIHILSGKMKQEIYTISRKIELFYIHTDQSKIFQISNNIDKSILIE